MSEIDNFLRDYTDAVIDQTASVFVGAGISRSAGYPSWKELLRDIAVDLKVSTDDLSDLAALAQWKIRQDQGRSHVLNVIKQQIAVDKPIPEVLRTLVRLPIRSFWTTNYDQLIERALSEAGRQCEIRASEDSLSLRSIPEAAQIYKMHGTITDPAKVVISTDDYELFRRVRGSFMTLLQSQMTTTTFLFAGMSLTDPNVRHVLALIRERFSDSPPEHFAIVRAPTRGEFSSKALFDARSQEHQHWADDLKRYGLRVIEIKNYDEVGSLLKRLERRVAARRVWISGSWPLDGPGDNSAHAHLVYDIASKLGELVLNKNLNLVSGSGLLVGSASISGFVAAAQIKGLWDLTRRLVARPFPQPPIGKEADRAQWTALRTEMARLAGILIVVGGSKVDEGQIVIADGVIEEVRLAAAQGAAVIPIGATGGAALHIANEMLQAKAHKSVVSKEEIRSLMEVRTSTAELVQRVSRIIDRISST